LSVIVCFAILREIFTRSAVAYGALAFFAFNPQFVFVSSSISNDNLMTLLSLLIVWASVCVARRGLTLGRGLVIAGLLAAAVLTKLSAAIVGIVPLLVILASKVTWRQRIRHMAVIAAVVAVATGWWFGRNYLLYGDWTGIRTWQQIWGWQTSATGWTDIGIALQNTWTSYWGRFGLGQIVLPQWLYTILLAINVLGLLGLVKYGVSSRRAAPASSLVTHDSTRLTGPLILAILLFVMLGALIGFGLVNATGVTGRYLLPAGVAIGGFLFWGLRSLYRPGRPEVDGWFVVSSYGGMLAVSIAALVGVIAPAYAHPAAVTLAEVRNQTQPLDIRFGDAAILLGAAIDHTRVVAGDDLRVKLCWQTLQPTSSDTYFLLHVLGKANAILGQRTSLHGLGRYPSSQWTPNGLFCDDVALQVDRAAPAPQVYQLEVGMVDLASGRRLTAINPGGVSVSPVLLHSIKVRALQPSPPVTAQKVMAYDFGQQIRLLGIDLDRERLQPGETMTITLHWQARRELDTDYTVFVHLLDPAGQLVTQADSQPQQGSYPTSLWDVDEVVLDPHVLVIPSNAVAGEYRVVAGLYLLGTGERLPLTGYSDDRAELARLIIGAP
jgi:hypothetical protein